MTSRELARLLGVSQSTVSRSLSGSREISEETKKRVLEAAQTYHFALNANARKLRSSQIDTVGVLMPNDFVDFYKNIFLGDLFSSLRNEFAKIEIDLIPLNTRSETLNSNVKKIVNAKKIDALLILRQVFPDDLKALLKDAGIPYMFVNHADMENADDHCVFVDYCHAGHEAGAALAAHGGAKIICLETTRTRKLVDLVTAGFRNALRERGTELPEERIFSCEGSFEEGFRFVTRHEPLINQSTAIFVIDDQMAMGVVQACNSLGITIPNQLEVIGFYGIELAGWITPKIQSLKINTREIAAKTVELFQRVAKKKDSETVEQAVIRGRLE